MIYMYLPVSERHESLLSAFATPLCLAIVYTCIFKTTPSVYLQQCTSFVLYLQQYS